VKNFPKRNSQSFLSRADLHSKSIEILGEGLKSLISLRSLSLNFSWAKIISGSSYSFFGDPNVAKIDGFFAGLKTLTSLQNLALKFE